jgi:anti-anti-sigma regulatory factor
MTSPTPHSRSIAVLIVSAIALTVAGCDPASSTQEDGDDIAGPASTESTPDVDLEAQGTAVDGFRRLRVFRIDDVLTAKFLDNRLDDSAGDIGHEFSRLTSDADTKTIILDFESIQFFSDKPLEELMATKTECDAKGRQLILCGLRGKVDEVFRIMHFDKVFTIETDLATALQRARS